MTRDDPRIVRAPIQTYGQPKNGYVRNIMYRYWVYDPECDAVLFWKPDKQTPSFSHPQCHDNEAVAEHLRSKLYPWADLRFVELISVVGEP